LPIYSLFHTTDFWQIVFVLFAFPAAVSLGLARRGVSTAKILKTALPVYLVSQSSLPDTWMPLCAQLLLHTLMRWQNILIMQVPNEAERKT
jgi:hypothetical protein